jgi:hypothetical protein
MNATVRDSLRLADTSVPPLPEDSTIEVLTSDSLYLIADGIGQSDTATSPLPLPYSGGFFSHSPLLHPESTRHEAGYEGHLLAPQPWHDDWMTIAVLLLLVTMILMLRRTAKQLYEQARQFVLPSRSREATTDMESLISFPIMAFSALLLSFTGAYIAILHIVYEREIFLGHVSPYLLFILFTLCFLAAITAKFIAYRFVNWVFFDKRKCFTWRSDYKLLFVAEAVILFLVIVFGTYFNFPHEKVLCAAFSILVFVKFLLLLKGYQIFFSDFHGIFHEIVYLCTLEATPLLAAIKILSQVTKGLNVFF